MKEFTTAFIDANFDLDFWDNLTKQEMLEGVRLFHRAFVNLHGENVWDEYIPISEIETMFTGMSIMKHMKNG